MPSCRVPFNGEWVYVLFIVDNEGVVNGIKEDKGRGDKCKEVRYEGVVTEMNNDTGKVLFLDGDKFLRLYKFGLIHNSKGTISDHLGVNVRNFLWSIITLTSSSQYCGYFTSIFICK